MRTHCLGGSEATGIVNCRYKGAQQSRRGPVWSLAPARGDPAGPGSEGVSPAAAIAPKAYRAPPVAPRQSSIAWCGRRPVRGSDRQRFAVSSGRLSAQSPAALRVGSSRRRGSWFAAACVPSTATAPPAPARICSGAEPHQLGDAARVLAIGLDRHRLECVPDGRVSSNSTGNPASRMPAYNHCDSGLASA